MTTALCGVPHYQYAESLCTEPAGHYVRERDPHAGPLIIDGEERGGVSWDEPEEQPAGPDTCRSVDVDGAPVLVRGAGDFTEEDAEFFAEVVAAAKRKHAAEHPEPAAPKASELHITPWKCPFCVAGIEPSDDGQGRERCLHCTGTGLTDQPCGPAERAPRPPGVMRAPCADCAFRPGSPELEENGARLPEDEPFFCHQGLPVSAFGAYTPTAMFRGLPLGAMVCAGWWALRTGETLPSKPYREVPVTED